MNARFPLVSEAQPVIGDAARCAREIAQHLVQHGARLSWHGDVAVLDFDLMRGILRPVADRLELRAEAADASLLREIELELSEHVVEFTGIGHAEIHWHGNLSDRAGPPNFRLMRVEDSWRITPHMQRVRLSGSQLLRFSGSGNFHCKLLIPQSGAIPEWPKLDAGGAFRWPSGPGKPIIRKYTIRHVDVENGTLDIDMVVHADGGPGSTWATQAAKGDVVGIVGPGGRSVQHADWRLLVGDETALPAIARAIEAMPRDARGVALIEVADRAEEQPIRCPAGFEIKWLHRAGAMPGTTKLLSSAVRAIELPIDTGSVFVWVGCEFAAFKDIRSYVRKELKLPKEQYLITSYWRRGHSEESPGPVCNSVFRHPAQP